MAKKIIRNPNDFDPIVVNGCLIEPNSVYEIVPKTTVASNVPDIYRTLDSIKERIPGVSNTITLTQSDTGFFEGSFVFNKMEETKNDWNKRQQLADKYFEIFALPMRNYISEIEKIRIPTDDVFFDKIYPTGYLTVKIGEGIQFKTDNPVDRFKLYIAIIEGELVMKGKRTSDEKEIGLKDETDMYHQDAQYSYVSITEKKNRKELQVELEMEASYTFNTLLREDKRALIGLLSYINIQVKQDASQGEIMTAYKTKIEPYLPKLKEFIEVADNYNNDRDSVKTTIDLLEKLKTKKGRELIKKEGATYVLISSPDKPLGSNLKSVVASLLKMENSDILTQFYLQYDN